MLLEWCFNVIAFLLLDVGLNVASSWKSCFLTNLNLNKCLCLVDSAAVCAW
jgi:hypothetical protein